MELQKEEWFSALESLSVPFQKYGSFLPEQRELLERVYEKLTRAEGPVWVFVAPPASGKTHAICLLARILSEATQRTAIVVPNNYLKEEFEGARSEVCGGLPAVDVLNVSEYLKTKKQYDFILADEAHNLKSFIELDISLVRSVSLSANDELYADIANRYLSPNRAFAAQQLSFSSAKDLLDSLNRNPRLARQLRQVVKDPTSWSYFIYVWREFGLCIVKFARANGLCKLKLPSKHLLMFSASPLSDEELDFYCGIPRSAVERALAVESTTEWREKQRLCISVMNGLPPDAKIDLLMSLIRESRTRILILFNSFRSCQKTFARLSNGLSNVFMIPCGSASMDIYKQFLGCTDGVLLTSSTVFWEGITIRGLKLVIIAEPPFPRPHLIELAKSKVVDGRLDMIRRLQQGLGRVGRSKEEWGLGLMLFDLYTLCKQAQKIIGSGTLLRMRAWDCPLLLHKVFVDKTVSIKSLSEF